MAQENEKPVFFFDIDNCVCKYLLLCAIAPTNRVLALPKECVLHPDINQLRLNGQVSRFMI